MSRGFCFAMEHSDTIAAVATPLGQGGIGIIRMSGPRSHDLGKAVFRSAREGFSGFRPYTLHHGWITEAGGEPLDEVLVSYMPAPGSYTGEDVVEINCHGGPAVVQRVLELLLRQGARMAEPGEFTFRAFLNGRMDLTRAESVAEMVSAPTDAGVGLASAKLSGRLQEKVSGIREGLERLRSLFTAAIDFSEEEEGTGLPEIAEIREQIRDMEAEISLLLENFRRHRCLQDGASVVLAGKVNAGKSSLLNAILGRTRAIVAPHPGTTRDYLEEMVNLRGVPVRLTDIAGLRSPESAVEQAGVEQAREMISGAALVCLVFDQSQPLEEDILETALEIGADKLLAVGNKADLSPLSPRVGEWFSRRGMECLSVSAQTGWGVDTLVSRIPRRILGEEVEPPEGELVPNIRQQEKLSAARQELNALLEGLDQGLPADVMETHLDCACTNLAEITGEISTEEVLDRVFSSFCIGK